MLLVRRHLLSLFSGQCLCRHLTGLLLLGRTILCAGFTGTMELPSRLQAGYQNDCELRLNYDTLHSLL